MEKIKNFFFFLFIASIAIGFGIETTSFMPDDAPVLVDLDRGTYESNQCASNEAWMSGVIATLEEAKRAGFLPNKRCLQSGGFSHSTKILYRMLGNKPNWG